jgi:hypothetical protein
MKFGGKLNYHLITDAKISLELKTDVVHLWRETIPNSRRNDAQNQVPVEELGNEFEVSHYTM